MNSLVLTVFIDRACTTCATFNKFISHPQNSGVNSIQWSEIPFKLFSLITRSFKGCVVFCWPDWFCFCSIDIRYKKKSYHLYNPYLFVRFRMFLFSTDKFIFIWSCEIEKPWAHCFIGQSYQTRGIEHYFSILYSVHSWWRG